MSYDTIEAAVLTRVRNISGYSSTNTSEGDYRILAKGVSKAVILQPGAIRGRTKIATPRRLGTTWVVLIELFIPFIKEISDVADSIRTERQLIMDEMDKYPTLDQTTGVIHAWITSSSEPDGWQGSGRRWWTQTLECEVTEHVTVTIAE